VTHELFKVQNASHETLGTILVGGAVGALILLALVGFLIWRDKRKGIGKPRLRPPRRARKPRRR
jgi:uncharacterized iron-regulated membrane protein